MAGPGVATDDSAIARPLFNWCKDMPRIGIIGVGERGRGLLGLLLDRDDVVALIYLDILMLGSILSDVGGLIRSFCNEKMRFRDLLVEGYPSEMSGYLTNVETISLTFSGLAIALLQTIRLLTDRLNGKIYQLVDFKGQNLEQAAQQFNLYQNLIS